MWDRIRNEPALLVAVIVAVANLVGVDPDQVEQIRTVVTETLVLIIGGFAVRQSVFSRRTHEDEVVDAASHAHHA